MNPLKHSVAVLLASLLLLGGSIAAPAVAANPCTVVDATLTWGFKESFRSYISGSIANGEWAVADGATYETPDFGWADGVGSYDAGEGQIGFEGSIRFTGHGGVLDTTVANPKLRFTGDGAAVLLLDVVGVTQDGAPIDQDAVEFVELDLTDAVQPADGTVTITAAPAVLTQAGATAFGTYPADEPFDPVTATFTLPSACAQAADGGPASSTAPTWIVWVVLGGAVAAIALVVVLVRVRRPPV